MRGIGIRGFVAIATFFAFFTSAGAEDLLLAPGQDGNAKAGDNVEHPLGKKQSDLRKQGLHKLLKGQAQAKGANKVVEVAKGQFVELAREGEDKIWTILGEFGTPDQPDLRRHGRTAAQPDSRSRTAAVDNTTIWAPDFSQAYYENLLFSAAPGAVSMRNFYIEQSSNRYTVNGDVTDWVQVPFNEANYGTNYCGGIVCARTWLFVRDAANAWYDAQIAAGKTPAEINAYLSQFDVWDRYDYDGDGNFNEPDGYIDHFQVVHAGEGEETGGGAQGTDAIWSHRWYAFYNNIGVDWPGPHQARRHPDRRQRLLDRRLHGRARERRRRRVRARVRPRPRPARPVRHQRQHRRRRELDRLLDAVLAAAPTAARASRPTASAASRSR